MLNFFFGEVFPNIIENVNESFQFLAYIVNVMNPGKFFVKGNSQFNILYPFGVLLAIHCCQSQVCCAQRTLHLRIYRETICSIRPPVLQFLVSERIFFNIKIFILFNFFFINKFYILIIVLFS